MGVSVAGQSAAVRARIRSLEAAVHAVGKLPSVTALSTLSLYRAEANAELSEAEEQEALRVSPWIDELGDDVYVTQRLSGFEGRPRVLISRRRHDGAEIQMAYRYLAQLARLGNRRSRGAVLERAVFEPLRAGLGPLGFRVDLRARQFHSQTSDITIIGGRRLFNVELRNRRAAVADRLLPHDAGVVERDADRGIITVFVVPRSTQRFRREVVARGGVVIDSATYVVRTREQQGLLQRMTWLCWSVQTPDIAGPAVAGQIAKTLLGRDLLAGIGCEMGGNTADPDLDSRAEVRRLLSSIARPGSKRRVEVALQLHREGIGTLAEAAATIGCHRSTLGRDFVSCGISSPWGRGGRRDGAGRKSK